MTKALSFLLFMMYWAKAWAEPPKPLLWQVSDKDNSVYLLGSFHMLKVDDYPLAAVVDQIFDESRKIYFEVSPDDLNDAGLVKKMMETGYLKGRTLEQILKPKTWRQLVNYCNANQLPIETFKTMKPWLAAMTIANIEIAKAGFLPDLGLDKHYMEIARIAKKETEGLETLSQQFSIFDQMDQKTQAKFLSLTLDEAQDFKDLKELHRRWRNGDDEGLMQLLSKDSINQIPEFYRHINVERNRAWLPKIVSFLQENSEVNALVVVGSLHLLGTEGLVDILRRQGLRVVRVQ